MKQQCECTTFSQESLPALLLKMQEAVIQSACTQITLLLMAERGRTKTEEITDSASQVSAPNDLFFFFNFGRIMH